MVHDRNAEIGQMLLRPDAGQQQKLRRVDGATAQDHLAPGTRGAREAVLTEGDTDGAVAVEDDAFRQRTGDDAEVAPLRRRLQVADAVEHRRPLRVVVWW